MIARPGSSVTTARDIGCGSVGVAAVIPGSVQRPIEAGGEVAHGRFKRVVEKVGFGRGGALAARATRPRFAINSRQTRDGRLANVRIMFAIGWFLAGAIAIFVAVIAAHRTGYLIVFPDGKQQVELVSVFLTAATLVITVVAMGLAVAAVVGYTALKDAASAAGKDAGEKVARELLAELVQREVASRLGPDRTEELTAALADRGNDAEQSQN